MNRKELQDALRPLKADNTYIKLNAKTTQLETWYNELVLGQQTLDLTPMQQELKEIEEELDIEVAEIKAQDKAEYMTELKAEQAENGIDSKDDEPVLVDDHKEQVIEVYYSVSGDELYSYQINTNEKIAGWTNEFDALTAAKEEVDSWFEDNENMKINQQSLTVDADDKIQSSLHLESIAETLEGLSMLKPSEFIRQEFLKAFDNDDNRPLAKVFCAII